jgi:hypothetical protein
LTSAWRCFTSSLPGKAEDGQFRLEEASLFLKAYQETLMSGQTPGPLDTNELKYLPAMINAANIYVLNWTIQDFYNKTVNPQEYLPFLAHAVELIRWLDRDDHARQLNEMISEDCTAGTIRRAMLPLDKIYNPTPVGIAVIFTCTPPPQTAIIPPVRWRAWPGLRGWISWPSPITTPLLPLGSLAKIPTCW